MRAGRVKITPDATDCPAFPVVCTILFSRMVARPKARRILIESTAMGIDGETVRPARGPTYTVTPPKRIPNIDPRSSARGGNSLSFVAEGTYGANLAHGGAAAVVAGRAERAARAPMMGSVSDG